MAPPILCGTGKVDDLQHSTIGFGRGGRPERSGVGCGFGQMSNVAGCPYRFAPLQEWPLHGTNDIKRLPLLRICLFTALVLMGAGIHSAAADNEGGGVLAPTVTRPIGSPNYQAMARTKVFDFRDRLIGPAARRALDERREVWIELNDDFSGAEVRLPMACDSTFATVEAMLAKLPEWGGERRSLPNFRRAIVFRGRSIEQVTGRAGPCDDPSDWGDLKTIPVRPGDVIVVPVMQAAGEVF